MTRLFLSRLFSQRGIWVLPIVAFAITSGIAFCVVAGSVFFFTIDSRLQSPELVGFYSVLAGLALVLLVVPMISLMSSSTRLLARRRDERLSSLRLLGARSRLILRLALTESMVLAGIGVTLGVGVYALLMPLVAQLRFGGGPIGMEGIWMGVGPLALVYVALLALAALAAMSGLRRISITPLGVRTRTLPARVHWIRVALVFAALIISQVLAQVMGVGGQAAVLVIVVAAIVVPLLGVQFAGPWVLKLVTRWQLRRARTAERLIAARNVLESPQQMWRQVGGVSVVTYVGVIVASGAAMMNAVQDSGVTGDHAMLVADIQLGVWLTLGIAFLMSACSVGINQSAQVIDRAPFYASLHCMGFGIEQLNAVRRLSVMRSLGVVMAIALAAALLTALPLIGASIVLSPMTAGISCGVLILGMLLVRGGVSVTSPAMRRAVSAQ